MENNWRSTAGTIGGIVLAIFLIFWGFTMLVPLAVPAWVGALLAILAGVLLLVGK